MILALIMTAGLALSARAQDCGFAQTIHGPFQFRQVEMVSRVHSIGTWRGGDVVLNPWIEISENAYLGIDRQGRVLNVLKLKDRTVAFLLSGERKIKDLFFRAPGQLTAIDDRGELLQYRQTQWQKTTVRSIVARSAMNYAATMCTAGLGLFAYSWFAQTPFLSPEVVGSLGLSSIAAVMIEAFRASARFEKQNEDTDGFESLGVKVEGFRRSEFVRGETGRIEDYDLGQGRSLARLSANAADEIAQFDVTCEHELLPRGIPPEEYEPKFR
jgi:hypothetical protein